MNKEIKITEEDIIEYNKLFADGRQDITLEQYINEKYNLDTTSSAQNKLEYWWQSNKTFNFIKITIASLKAVEPEILDAYLYGTNGVVDLFREYQIQYNMLQNRRVEVLNRLVSPNLLLEDGSVDVDSLESEGLAPGRILVYRQNATKPEIDYRGMECLINIYDRLTTQIDKIDEKVAEYTATLIKSIENSKK